MSSKVGESAIKNTGQAPSRQKVLTSNGMFHKEQQIQNVKLGKLK